jgi:hypothetical protein
MDGFGRQLAGIANALSNIPEIVSGFDSHRPLQFHGGDSLELTMTNTEGGVTRVSQIKGRRTGDCKAGGKQSG